MKPFVVNSVFICWFALNCIVLIREVNYYPIFSTFSNLKNKTHNNVKSFEEIKFRNYNSVKSELLNVDWSLVLNSSICDFAYDNFITIFSAIFNKNFPLITKAVQKSHNKPYITQEIKELIIERNKLLKKSIKYSLTYYQQYKQHRNQVTKEIRNSRSKYFRSRLQSCTGDGCLTFLYHLIALIHINFFIVTRFEDLMFLPYSSFIDNRYLFIILLSFIIITTFFGTLIV